MADAACEHGRSAHEQCLHCEAELDQAEHYQQRGSPTMADRIDARRLVDTNVTARTVVDMIASLYLRGDLSVAEFRVLFTMGLERGMMLETRHTVYVKKEPDDG